MTGIMGSIGNSNEPYALITGVIAIVSSVVFFLQRFNIINIQFVISEEIWLMFFAGFTLLSGIVHLLATVGMIGAR